MEGDTDEKWLQPAFGPAAVVCFVAPQHLEGAGNGPPGIILMRDRSPEQGHDPISNEFVDHASVGLDLGGHFCKVLVQFCHDKLGIAALAVSGVVTEVCEH